MTAFLRFLDHDVWQTVLNGYKSPTVDVDGKTVPKPVVDWTQGDKNQTHWNDRAMNAIYNGVNHSEFHRISTCATAKEAWDLLRTMHEGTDIVRQTKLQNLTTAFETMCMKVDETFDEYYAKLGHIVNSSFNLGEPILDQKVVKKILRSLPERFQSKVIAIEEYTNLNELPVEQLVGNLQTFEVNHCSDKKSKGIALMSSKENHDDESENDFDNVELEALFVKKFKKYLNINKKNLNKEFSKNKSFNKSKFVPKIDKTSSKNTNKPIQCFECQGFGHPASKCAN